MSQFYQRYQSLFQLDGYKPHALPQNKRYDLGGSYKASQHGPSYMPQFNHNKEPHFNNLSRSPALDQFQHTVLPKLNKKYPQPGFDRLRTQIEESNTKLAYDLENNNSFRNFYQLPKIYGPKQYSKRQRIITEGNQSVIKPTKQSRFHNFQELKNIKNADLIDRQYGNVYPRREDSIREQIHFKPKTPRAKGKIISQSRDPGLSRYEGHPIMARRWDVKVLPQRQSPQHFQGLAPSPKINKEQQKYRQFKEKQKELYGIKQNQFAFIHSKLDQIKRSQKYYPRGFINSYRDALFRRRKEKNRIDERRQQLKNLLYEEDVKYGVI